jgi:hypothetical protein
MRRAVAPCLVLLAVMGCLSVGQQLAGLWEFEVDINPQEADFSDALAVRSFVKVEYQVGDWTFASLTRFTDDGWTDQDFTAAGPLGPFTMSATVDFGPSGTFGSLITSITVPVDGVTLGSRFRLQGGDTFLTLTGRGTSGSVAINARVELGDVNGFCDFPFNEAVIGVAFPICCATISSSLSIDCDGFDQISFSTSGITLPDIPWLTVAAKLVFTTQTKSVTLSPTFNFRSSTCIDLYVSVDSSGPFSLGPASLDGIKLTCTLETVTFTGISYWGDGTKPSPLAGTPYWEVYTIETRQDACCGPLSFDLSVFFIEEGLRLFDVALFEANVELALADQFTFSTGITIDTEAEAISSWRLGFAISW